LTTKRSSRNYTNIEDLSNYTIKIDRFKKYAAILRNSIDYEEKGKERIFTMKDLASVEEAIDAGAEMISDIKKPEVSVEREHEIP
jgi:hypothetical protein